MYSESLFSFLYGKDEMQANWIAMMSQLSAHLDIMY